MLSLYISPDEIALPELRNLVERSYAGFRHPSVTPLRTLDGGLSVLELWHGPTFAFKDVALQLLGNLFEFFLARRNARKAPGEERERLTVVGATSGDTGRCVLSVDPQLFVARELTLVAARLFTDCAARRTSRSSSSIRRGACRRYRRRR